MSMEANFLRTIQASPEDNELRAAYADWLEQEGRPQEAEYLRVESRLAQGIDPLIAGPLSRRRTELIQRLSRAWLAQVDRSRLVACLGVEANVRLLPETCTAQWAQLTPTHKPCLRFCLKCQREVPFEATETGQPPSQRRQGWYWSHALRPIGVRRPPAILPGSRTNISHQIRSLLNDLDGPGF